MHGSPCPQQLFDSYAPPCYTVRTERALSLLHFTEVRTE